MLPLGFNGIPPYVIIRGTDFISMDYECDPQTWLTPDIMRLSTAFVLYDADGKLRKKYGNSLNDNGYVIRVLNLANLKLSARYNPFAYIRNDQNIPKLVDALITGTKGHVQGNANFVLSEAMLFTALISYIHDEAPDFERNLNTLIIALKHMEIEKDEDGCRYKHAVDFLMEDKEADDSYHLSVRQYNEFDEMTGDNPEHVIASCVARLSPFDTEEASNLLSDDELYLDELYTSKTAIFINPGDYKAQLNVLAALMYLQLLDVLCDNKAIPSSSGSDDYK